MMNIREYFEMLGCCEEYEQEVYEMEGEEFFKWAEQHNINLNARDERTGELVLTLWGWDMCGD